MESEMLVEISTCWLDVLKKKALHLEHDNRSNKYMNRLVCVCFGLLSWFPLLPTMLTLRVVSEGFTPHCVGTVTALCSPLTSGSVHSAQVRIQSLYARQHHQHDCANCARVVFYWLDCL